MREENVPYVAVRFRNAYDVNRNFKFSDGKATLC